MPPKKRKAPAMRPPATRAPSPGRGSDEEEEEEEGAGGPSGKHLAIWRDLEARVSALERELATRRAAKKEEEEGAKPGQQAVRPRSDGEDRPGGATCARPGAVGPGLPSPALPPCQGKGPPGGWAPAPALGLPLGGDAPWVPSGQTPRLPLPYGAPGPSGLAQPLCAPGRQMEGLDLGFHLLPSTKEKIRRGEFVDLFSLLNGESGGEEEEEEKHRVDRTWHNWLPAFLIYAGVLTGAQPWLASGLFEYLALIYKTRVDYRGPAWLQYDETFRRRKSLHPSLPWGALHPTLWLLCMRPATPYEGVRTDSGHLLRWPPPDDEDDDVPSCPAEEEEGRPGSSPFRRLCWHFGTRGSCDWQPCKFQHRCSLCGGPHSFLDCPKGKRAKKFWGGRKPSPRGEEPPQDPYSD